MRHASQSQFGRPVKAVHPSGLSDGPDKWHLLRDLTEAAEHFDLSHRALSVLKALLTFLPEREIPSGAGAVVFPSNRTLSNRLSGMPESTLRRHLNKLVTAGIVSRQDSPNRKRYARSVGASVTLAYGFDLTPLAALQSQLRALAKATQIHKEEMTVLRQRVMTLRASLIELEGQGALTDQTALLLRRKPDSAALIQAEKTLITAVDKATQTVLPPDKLSANDSQNERHIQYITKYAFDPETNTSEQNHQQHPVEVTDAEKENISLSQVVDRCRAFQSYYPEKVTSWRDIVGIGDQIAPMIGIDQPVIHQAKQAMGAQTAAVVILCILEKFPKIKSPGAYLRQLSKMAEQRMFSVLPMLNALERA